MLLQRVPAVNLAAAAAAKAAGVPIVVDAGGWTLLYPPRCSRRRIPLPERIRAGEAHPHADVDGRRGAAGLELVAQGAKRVLVTLGARGARSSARPASRGTTRCRCRAVRSVSR